jgi:thioredoxin-like negative regulator of GroEL
MLRPRRPTEDGFLGKYEPFVVVCFSAKWCGPCQKLDKVQLVHRTPAVKWFSCDIDENKVTLGYCGLRSVPSFVAIKDGMVAGRKSGAGSVDDVLNWLEEQGIPTE